MSRTFLNASTRKALLTAVTLAVGSAVGSARAAAQGAPDRAADSTAVIAAAQSVLRAIVTGDSALARKVLLPGMQFLAINDPSTATTTARGQSDSSFIAFVGTPGQKMIERMWEPQLFLQGSIALVRAPYDFHVDGAFSHCGVDTFTLVRTKGSWRVSHVAYTVQRTGCAPSPLGPIAK